LNTDYGRVGEGLLLLLQNSLSVKVIKIDILATIYGKYHETCGIKYLQKPQSITLIDDLIS